MNDDSALPEPARQAARDVVVVFNRLRRRLREVAVDGDLTPAQASVLVRLDKGGPATASELAFVERVRPQSIAKVVAALEAAGLVTRSPDPHDGRRQLVALTDQGRARRTGDRRARETWLARALAEHGTPEQIAAVTEAMALLDRVSGAEE
ncbi:MarR family winged helix-turn-helix transcriptional regulator [Streptomyces sp. NPDC021224]|uniref:MarR family winged helix-turn-helix transcriptional regulator n=1 Tax=unclassified Streptomyces TaxID=2593676 RepID=UPI00378CBA9A